MRIRMWPNRLGCDVGLTEVMLCRGEHGLSLRVIHYTESGHARHLIARPDLPKSARIEDVPGAVILDAVRECRRKGERVR